MNMSAQTNFNYNIISSGSANYYDSTTVSGFIGRQLPVTTNDYSYVIKSERAKYSIFDIANWFLSKGDMTHKKLQKLCYYAQAWSYAINHYRLANTDFQAWVHGPVSPALWDRFKDFGYDTITLKKGSIPTFEEKDTELLENIWETYGEYTGNALEALSHREVPWIEARKGYEPGEKCNVVISPKTMATYYNSIYDGD